MHHVVCVFRAFTNILSYKHTVPMCHRFVEGYSLMEEEAIERCPFVHGNSCMDCYGDLSIQIHHHTLLRDNGHFHHPFPLGQHPSTIEKVTKLILRKLKIDCRFCVTFQVDYDLFV